MSDRSLSAIRAGRALLGSELALAHDVTIVVRDGAIEVARPGVDAPPGASTTDARDFTVLPGFIDAHVHIGFYDPAKVLAGGVTTVRDLAWPSDQIWPLVERSRDPQFDGPTILAAGQMLTAPGGYPTRAAWAPKGTGLEVRDASEANAAVDEVASQGAAIVKIALNPPVGPVLDEETLTAIVREAHSRGLRVTGHISGLDELRKAVRAGIDELAHMLMSDEEIPEETIAEMLASDIAIVPTLSIFQGAGRKIAIDNLRRFAAAGGTIVYGTDLGNEGPKPGIDPLEVTSMNDAGLGPRAIIATATANSARYLGLERTGRIAPGMDADLIAVKGDPLEDPLALTDVQMVWRKGRRFR
jgi:imidazolonepropionase-like amidohydrolase